MYEASSHLILYLVSPFCRHITHKVLQERNIEGQTLLAIVEVNRQVDTLFHDLIMIPSISESIWQSHFH